LSILQITRGRAGSGTRSLCRVAHFVTLVIVAERHAVGYGVALAYTSQNVRGHHHVG
jgi:hypothetical protein